MHLNYILLLVSLLLACCDSAAFGQTKISKDGGSSFIQVSDSVPSTPTGGRYLLTDTTDEEAETAEGEERGLLNAAQQLKHRTKLITDGDIRRSRKTFESWYKMGMTPDKVWTILNLKPVANRGWDPKFNMYNTYKKFYEIKKGTYKKNA
ncbi:hypothetical protein PHYBOEH_003443 [Phytophthora boehmeriae]|uniref:RxLR effector protein n=1 Tax=Phytophthora boehmeriae TaxID=109152 RepID=A0A8T1WQ81_9STRA|nr:hypothetical protein PHYBOEH_003443 [Phytophthora boehmeriae]